MPRFHAGRCLDCRRRRSHIVGNRHSCPVRGAASYTWDIDGDGEFDDASGVTVTLTAAQLRNLGLDDNGEYVVAVRVTDTQPLFADGLATVTIGNVAPTLHAAGVTEVGAGEPYSLELTATDPGNDQIRRWFINWVTARRLKLSWLTTY